MSTRTLKARLVAEDDASAKIGRVATSLKLMAGAAVAAGLALGVRGLVRQVIAATNAAGKFETENVRLAAALRNTGQFTDATLASMQDYANELQKVSTASETQILQAQALSLNMGATADQANAAALAAVNMSAALGTDLETAVRQINRTLGGMSGEIAETVSEIKSLTEEQRKAGGAIDIVNKKFSGAALVAAQGYEGAINNLETAFNQLSVVIGGPFKEAVTVVLQELITPTIQGMTDAAKETDAYRTAVLQTTISVLQSARGLVLFKEAMAGAAGATWTMANVLSAIIPQTAAIRRDLKLAAQALAIIGAVKISDEAAESLERIDAAIARINDLLKNGPDTAGDLTKGIVGGTKPAISALSALDEKLKAIGVGSVTSLRDAGKALAVAFVAVKDGIEKGLVTGAEAGPLLDELKKKAEDLRDAGIDISLDFGGISKLSDALEGIGLSSGLEETRKQAAGVAAAFRAVQDAALAGKLEIGEYPKLMEEISRRADELGVSAQFALDIFSSYQPAIITVGEAINGWVEGTEAFNEAIDNGTVKVERMGDALSFTLRDQGVNAAVAMGDALVDAAFGAKIAWGDFLRGLIKQMIAAIVKMLILKAIGRVIGSIGGPAGAAAGEVVGGLVAQELNSATLANPNQFDIGGRAAPETTVLVQANGAVFLDEGMPARLARQISEGLQSASQRGVLVGA